MLFVQLTLIAFHYIIFARSGFLQDKFKGKVVKIDRFDGHCNGKNFPFRGFFQGVKGDTDSKSVSITNMTIVIKEDLMNKIRGIVTLTRCHSKENLDSCEDFSRISNFDICQLMNPDGLLGQNILAASFTPKFKCPYKKGSYYAYNYTANLTLFLVYNPDEWYWKIKIELFSPGGNRLLGRMCVEGCVVPKSRHN